MNAAPLEGVPVMLSGTKSAATTTDSNGSYSFSKLRAGGNYTITPVRPGMTFIPASRALSKLLRDESADFTSVIQPNVYKITGRVTDTRGPLAGAKINLEGSKLTSTLTDANGYYTFSDLREGGSYSVIPKGHLSFSPASRSFNNLRRNESADFSAKDQPVVYRISGRVRNAHQPLNGIRIKLDGTKSGSTTTDTNGYYSFTGLSAGGDYTITPSARLRFAPSHRSLNNLRQDGLADFLVEQENQTDEPDKFNDTTATACTDADQARERDALLNKYAATWERGIESEKPRIIEQAIKAQLPGVNAQSVEATAGLGSIRYDVAFDKCKPRVVTVNYQWQVKLYFNGESRAAAVRKRKTCGRVLGAWICH